MSFAVRPLEEQETLGAKLKQMRRRLAISMEQAAAKTNIQQHYLKALEGDDHNSLPEPIYTRNFIKRYVKFLGGDVKYFLKRFDQECGRCGVIPDHMRLPRQRVRRTKLLASHRLIKIGAVAVLCLSLAGYLGWQINSLMKAPTIILIEPEDGVIINQARVTVAGQVETRVQVWINGINILPDQSGYFSTLVDLERGPNIINIEAAKRYSKKAILYRTVVFEGHE